MNILFDFFLKRRKRFFGDWANQLETLKKEISNKYAEPPDTDLTVLSSIPRGHFLKRQKL
jgi:hypothetical protein